MLEDKLNRSERVRLEALAQAIAFHNVRLTHVTPRPTNLDALEGNVLKTAKAFSNYVVGDSPLGII